MKEIHRHYSTGQLVFVHLKVDLSELVGLGLFVFPRVNIDAVFTNYIICLVFNSRHVVNRPQHTISQPPNLPVPILDEEGTSPKYDHGDVIGVFTSSTIVIGTSLRMAALCIGVCLPNYLPYMSNVCTQTFHTDWTCTAQQTDR